jgi:DNA-directed RNA polymerase specialized sigma24 family protein
MPVEFRSGSSDGSALDQRVASAPPDADGNVYQTFTVPLFDYCAGLLGDQVAATGAVQDSLVAVDAQISAPPGPDRLRVSLYGTARRRCLGRRRAPARRSGTAAADQAGGTAPDVKAPRTVGETLPVVTAALARLPDRDREVLSLAFRHGIQGADLAAVLGLSSRRARSLLSAASARFGKSAAVAVVLRAGAAAGETGNAGCNAGCTVLAGIVSQQDAVPAPPAAKLVRLDRHVESCPDCARILGGRAFAPDLVSQVPFAVPAERLRLRMIRTSLAIGSYRRRAGLPDGSGSGRLRSRSR